MKLARVAPQARQDRRVKQVLPVLRAFRARPDRRVILGLQEHLDGMAHKAPQDLKGLRGATVRRVQRGLSARKARRALPARD